MDPIDDLRASSVTLCPSFCSTEEAHRFFLLLSSLFSTMLMDRQASFLLARLVGGLSEGNVQLSLFVRLRCLTPSPCRLS